MCRLHTRRGSGASDAALLSEGWHRCQPGGMLFMRLLAWLVFLEIGCLVGYLPLLIGGMGDYSQM